MYELIKVTDRFMYIDCPSKIGIIKTQDDKVCLIDSGNDKDAGKRVKKILDGQGFSISAIFNTHSHADHVGGNHYLHSQTGCRIFAPALESTFAKSTLLEPSLLYGGHPPKNLCHKFLMAEESPAEPLTDEVLPEGVSLLPLPGHSLNMTGLVVDGIVYLADALASEHTLDKYGLVYIYDVGKYLETLDMIKTLEGKLFVPSHAQALEDIAPLAQYNICKTLLAAECILDICKDHTPFDILLKELFAKYGLSMTVQQYALVGSTTRSYLSWLIDEGKLEMAPDNNVMLFHRI